jgi:hypothetical protein
MIIHDLQNLKLPITVYPMANFARECGFNPISRVELCGFITDGDDVVLLFMQGPIRKDIRIRNTVSLSKYFSIHRISPYQAYLSAIESGFNGSYEYWLEHIHNENNSF